MAGRSAEVDPRQPVYPRRRRDRPPDGERRITQRGDKYVPLDVRLNGIERWLFWLTVGLAIDIGLQAISNPPFANLFESIARAIGSL